LNETGSIQYQTESRAPYQAVRRVFPVRRRRAASGPPNAEPKISEDAGSGASTVMPR
jgi:hypothetical protein